MRVLVCGGRNYSDAATLWATLDTLWRQAKHDTMVVIQGGATGADQMAREWCAAREVMYENYPAHWTLHGKKAGPIRNQRMIDQGRPEIVVAFPGGRGTEDMIFRAENACIELMRIEP